MSGGALLRHQIPRRTASERSDLVLATPSNLQGEDQVATARCTAWNLVTQRTQRALMSDLVML